MITKNVWARRIALWVLLLAVLPAMSFAKTIYVKQDSVGNGTSWTSAYGGLQDALDVANAGDTIWVATGTYTPTYDYGINMGLRMNHFRMKNGVAIYGGFAGTESSLAQRDIYNNETILSGDLNGDDGPDFTNNSDNTIRVFYHPLGTALNSTAILDGFTITASNANSGGSYALGAGMHNYGSSPTISNCTFTGNYTSMAGAGMYNVNNSNPKVTNCVFSRNTSDYVGGGIYNANSSPIITNCIFQDNSAASYHGGGMVNEDNSHPIVTNCTFSGNSCGYYGGAIANFTYSGLTLTNGILWANSAAVSGNEIYIDSLSTSLIAYSNIAGCLNGTSWNTSIGTDVGGNMDENPNFDSYLQLQAGSPSIDAADGDAAPTTDLLGNLRYDDPAMTNIGGGSPGYVDMGAYEFQGDVGTTVYTLSVSSSGAAGVVITSSTGHGGTTNYAKTVDEGTTVTLTAPNISGKVFTGWTGSVASSSQAISLSMNAAKFVTANYETVSTTTYSLYVYSSGTSAVAIASSTGQSGTTSYSTSVNGGSTVTLTAPAAWNGMTFSRWSGAISSSSPTITFTMDRTKYVIAYYEQSTTPTTYALNVLSSGASGVAISSSTGQSGTTNYSKTVGDGVTVTLTAPATSGGATFTGWTGSVTSSSQTISLSMNAAKSVTANYQTTLPTTYTLSVSSAGASGVAIASSTGHSGTTNYTRTVDDGTAVTLTAPAISGGATFTGWTGAVVSGSQTISFAMNANKSVTANYQTVATVPMHVQSIVLSVIEAGGPNRKGQAVVTIYDSSNRPVSGATVVGTFAGSFSESGSAVTNASGQATLITASKSKAPSFTFTVTNVTASGYTYDPASNVETGDSY